MLRKDASIASQGSGNNLGHVKASLLEYCCYFRQSAITLQPRLRDQLPGTIHDPCLDIPTSDAMLWPNTVCVTSSRPTIWYPIIVDCTAMTSLYHLPSLCLNRQMAFPRHDTPARVSIRADSLRYTVVHLQPLNSLLIILTWHLLLIGDRCLENILENI